MTKTSIKPKWLRLTEEINALDYLEQAYYYIQQTEKNDIAWKWVVITLHGALYGFAICACKGTNKANVTFKTKSGKEKLIDFDDALKCCQDQDLMKTIFGGKHLQLSNEQNISIKMLKQDFRNYFEHYIPAGWSIEIHGMPEMTINVLNVIRFLAINTGTCIHFNSTQKRKIKSLVFQSKRILKQSQLYKEALL
jgi:hypothetical protein